MKSIALVSLAIAAAMALPTAANAALSRASFAFSGGGTAAFLINGNTTNIAIRQGWVAEDGGSNFGAGNYIAGICGSDDACGGDNLDRNNWFLFDLSAIGGVSSAVLIISQPATDGYISTQLSETYTLWDTDLAGGLGSASGIGFYNDLESGTSFGSVSVDASSMGNSVMITFNAAGIAALNANAGGLWGVGGSLNFSDAVPEPASWAMLIAGFGFTGAMMRRRRAVIA